MGDEGVSLCLCVSVCQCLSRRINERERKQENEGSSWMHLFFFLRFLGQEMVCKSSFISLAERWTTLITLPFCYLPIPRIARLHVCALFAERKQLRASGWM